MKVGAALTVISLIVSNAAASQTWRFSSERSRLPPPTRPLPALPRPILDPFAPCMRLSGGVDVQIGLPDMRLLKSIQTANAEILRSRPMADPKPWQLLQFEPDRYEERKRLAEAATIGDMQLDALRRFDAQARRLKDVMKAVRELGAMEAKHMERATTGDLPPPSRIALVDTRPSWCLALRPGLIPAATPLTETHWDLAFTEETSHIVMAVKDGTVRPASGKSVSAECVALRAERSVVGCAPLPSPFDHYYIHTFVCTRHGLLPAIEPEPPKFGCVSWQLLPGPPAEPRIVRAFHETVKESGSAAKSILSESLEKRRLLADRNRTTLSHFESRLDLEHASLGSWRHELDLLKKEVDLLSEQIARERNELNVAIAGQGTVVAEQAITETLIADLDKKLENSVGTIADLERKAEQLVVEEQNLVLKCGGASYKECVDSDAKLSYDKQRYELRQSYMNIQQRLASERAMRRTLLPERRKAIRQASTLRIQSLQHDSTVGRLSMLLPPHEERLSVQSARYGKEQPESTQMAAANAEARKLAKALRSWIVP